MLLCQRVHGVTVEHLGTNVHSFSRQRHIVAVWSRAHGEEEAAPHHEVPYLVGHSKLQVTHLAVSKLVGHGLLQAYILNVPLLTAVVGPELTILTGEILMVQVQPVVGGQHPSQNLLVVYHVVRYLGIGEHQRHRIVPRQLVLRRIDGYLGGFLQPHGIHIDRRVCYMAQYRTALSIGNHLAGDTPQAALALYAHGILRHEAAASVVQQPRHLGLTLQSPVSNTISLQVVLLRLVHGHHYIRRVRPREKKKTKKNYGSERE